MQVDMHFYGTYTLALMAGIPQEDARTIAYAAQYVDVSDGDKVFERDDGSVLRQTRTYSHELRAARNSLINREQQRLVWVPFHFLPGNRGESLSERLICQPDSEIARKMMEHHIKPGLKHPFGLHLLGVASHVYMDTFSHYGFSGISSPLNAVVSTTIKHKGVKNPEVAAYIENKSLKFFKKYTAHFEPFIKRLVSDALEAGSRNLGHAGVSTYPDRPFLNWSFDYEKGRYGNGKRSARSNPKTYLYGCKKLHGYFKKFAELHYADPSIQSFDVFEEKIYEILCFEGGKKDRIKQWTEASLHDALKDAEYDDKEWKKEETDFATLKTLQDGIDTNAYRFHQAAALHRSYVLKELLPNHGIAVY